jgi:hypothetical protein
MMEVDIVVIQIQMATNVDHDKELFHAKNYNKNKTFNSLFEFLPVHIEVERQEHENS